MLAFTIGHLLYSMLMERRGSGNFVSLELSPEAMNFLREVWPAVVSAASKNENGTGILEGVPGGFGQRSLYRLEQVMRRVGS